MKKYYIFLFFISFSDIGFSQNLPVEAWRDTFFVEESGLDPARIKLDSSQNTYMICNNQSISGISLLKFDSTGTRIWASDFSIHPFLKHFYTFTLDDAGNTYTSVKFNDNYHFLPQGTTIFKHDPDGNIAWQKKYGTFEDRFNFAEMDTMGRLIIAGQNVSYDSTLNDFGFVNCINPANGDIIWQYILSGWHFNLGMKILSDKTEIVSYRGEQESLDFLEIVQIDYDGNLIQEYSKELINTPLIPLYVNPLGEVILGNDANKYSVTKITDQIDTLWHYVYPFFTTYSRSRDVIEDQNGEVYATGIVIESDSLDSEMLTCKFSSTGTLLWQKKYNVTNEKRRDGANKIGLDSQYAYAVGAGESTSPWSHLTIIAYNKVTGDQEYEVLLQHNLVFYATDIVVKENRVYYTASSHGGISDSYNSITGCVKFPSIMISATNLKENPAVSVFPNPSTEMVHITGLDPQQFERVDLLDLQGNLIVTQQVSSEAMSIPLGAVPVGTYTLVLRGGHIKMTKQIVVVR